MAAAHLPFELIESIIDHLRDDPVSLLSCALIHPSWTTSSQTLLFYAVDISDIGALCAFIDCLKSSPHLRPNVRVMSLRNLWWAALSRILERHRDASDPLHRSFWGELPNMKTLHVAAVDGAILQLSLVAFPSVENLVLERCSWVTPAPVPAHDIARAQAVDVHPTFFVASLRTGSAEGTGLGVDDVPTFCLRSLRLVRCTFFEGLLASAACWPGLEGLASLHVDHIFDSLSAASLSLLLAATPRLQFLRIRIETCSSTPNNMVLGNLPLLSELHISSTCDRRGLAALFGILAHTTFPALDDLTLALGAYGHGTCDLQLDPPAPTLPPALAARLRRVNVRFAGVGDVRGYDTLAGILGSAAAPDVLTVDLGGARIVD